MCAQYKIQTSVAISSKVTLGNKYCHQFLWSLAWISSLPMGLSPSHLFWGNWCGWVTTDVAVSVCGRFGLWQFRLCPFRFVAVMTCYHMCGNSSRECISCQSPSLLLFFITSSSLMIEQVFESRQKKTSFVCLDCLDIILLFYLLVILLDA